MNSSHSLENILNTNRQTFTRKRWLWAAVAAIALVAGMALVLRHNPKAPAVRFETQPVTRGTLVVKVSATGHLQPTNEVDVGSELSGTVEKVFVDENDRVKKGQVLALLDRAKLNDAVAKSHAGLAAADAQVLQAEATVAEAHSLLARYQKLAEVSGGKAPSISDMDMAEANAKRAEANAASARASVAQARANLQSDLTNLEKAKIRSLIDGVVLTRNIEPGQTVAASFQVAVLFTLAEDLTKMALKVNIDEAEVGHVTAGQKAVFTVDAWPERKYSAVVTRVGYGSKEQDGVISYPALLQVSNEDLSLRPGMTGSADVTTMTHENALLVPSVALRFTPPATEATPKKGGGGAVGFILPRPPGTTSKPQVTQPAGPPRVWILRDGQPLAIDVKTGAGNGKVTEITGGSLQEGMPVITETAEAAP